MEGAISLFLRLWLEVRRVTVTIRNITIRLIGSVANRTVCGSARFFLSVLIASHVRLTASRRFRVSTAHNNNQEMAHRRTSLPYNYKYLDNRNLSAKSKAATLPFVNIDFLQKIDEKGLPGTPANNLALYEEKLEEAV